MQITISKGGGYTILTHIDEHGIYRHMRYLYYSMRECKKLYREQFGLTHTRVTYKKEY